MGEQQEGLLEVDGLAVAYGRAIALSQVSFKVEEAGVTGVIGPNGAGKTTMLNAISGVLSPRRGKVIWNGREITGHSSQEVSRIGVIQVPEGRRLFPELTVLENLRVGSVAVGLPAEKHLDFVLEVFPELKRMLGRRAGALSGGEQQMVAIGRGLMAEPRLLMVDELSLGLAPKAAQRLVDALADLAQSRGLAILLVDQNVRLLARRVERFTVISHGEVVFTGGVAELSDDSALAAYMGRGA
ncbi:MAG TPA: ABC transporter ATP-binding protein [Solirubrobacterales bacterium]|jgi:branched-chain amino acid transport system ATP-binding protein|nr:ABC transporter ATP-binding protein [Solirubrobacterales bacterium]